MSLNYGSTMITQANTPTSYVDILGLYLGLSRFVGETNTQFLARLYKSAKSVKDTSVKGLINNLSSILNLNTYKGISLTYPNNTLITCVPGELTISSTKIPLFNLAEDTYIEWRLLSDVVNDINNIEGISATLLVADGPALKLSQQSNSNIYLNEAIDSINLSYSFKNQGFIPGSELFNLNTSSYSITNNVITFESAPSVDLTVSYQTISSNYNLVVSDVSLVPLVAGPFITNSTNSDNQLGYQVREAIQTAMSKDLSYWGL